ncbi:MAG: PAS domain-containing protein [Thiobacillus sp.]|nr:PAS domain-containing protein [Thiobacillus sp.]
MKNPNITPTSVEKVMREDDFIVSKTDLTGRITYGNRIFVEFSGYSEEELLGSQHNIIRHPDMPRGVFKFLWDTIQDKNECNAYVKNMAKDGSFYWVFANVVPDFSSNGEITGFTSVRRKPRTEVVKLMSGVYQTMLEIEQKAGPKDACAASLRFLTGLLAEKQLSYGEFILSL